MLRLCLIVAAAVAAGPVFAVACRGLVYEGNTYTLCDADAAHEDIRLFWRDSNNDTYRQFSRLEADLEDKGMYLEFAMNAGMYHPDRSPVGYYLEDGEAFRRLVTSASPGNFGLLPNGVLCIRAGQANVIETRRFTRERPACRDATQSGPMLVIDGRLHPRFLKDSNSRHVRNGVGSSADGRRIVFAISEGPVTFHEFGRLFRDLLDLPQALYFDGNVSRLYAPAMGRADPGFGMGPIIGIVRHK